MSGGDVGGDTGGDAMKVEVQCHTCKKVHSFDDIVSFRVECDKCTADLHICLNCRFYDRYVENECREDQAEFVAVKDRRNLCEYFKPIVIGTNADDETKKARAKLDALFGGPKTTSSPVPSAPSPSSSTDDAKAKLEALFKKKT